MVPPLVPHTCVTLVGVPWLWLYRHHVQVALLSCLSFPYTGHYALLCIMALTSRHQVVFWSIQVTIGLFGVLSIQPLVYIVLLDGTFYRSSSSLFTLHFPVDVTSCIVTLNPTLTLSIGLYCILWIITYTNIFHISPLQLVLAPILTIQEDHYFMDKYPFCGFAVVEHINTTPGNYVPRGLPILSTIPSIHSCFFKVILRGISISNT